MRDENANTGPRILATRLADASACAATTTTTTTTTATATATTTATTATSHASPAAGLRRFALLILAEVPRRLLWPSAAALRWAMARAARQRSDPFDFVRKRFGGSNPCRTGAVQLGGFLLFLEGLLQPLQ